LAERPNPDEARPAPSSDMEIEMTQTRQITKDNAYDAVSPDDFQAMMNTERYNRRSSAFDKIISATHDHFWDPLDKKYIDFSEPFDLEHEMAIDPQLVPELKLPCFEKLSEKEKVRFVNETARWMMSAIATSCSIRAHRNMPRTRRAKKRAM
jgi:hypothetical protein